VARLHGHAELEEFALGFQHAGKNTLGDDAEVLVFKLLALGRLGAEERAPAVHEVGARKEEVAVDEEVFLFGAGGGGDESGAGVAEQFQDALGLVVQGAHGAEHRRLLVQRLAGPGDERSGDAERGAIRVFQDVGGAGHVPGSVAARLEG